MSSIQIRKAGLNDADNIIHLLEQFYPGVPHHWRKLFNPRTFNNDDDFPGLIIEDGEKVVGFLGTILSNHDTSKGKLTICNLSTWYVDPAYRQHSMMLFLKVMKLPNIAAWTNLTAAPHTYEWFQRSGYESFVDKQTVIFPLPSSLLRRRSVTLCLDFAVSDLPPDQQWIYQKHQQPHCHHVLIKKGDKQCYCIIVLTRYKKIPLGNVYYISDRHLFNDMISEIRMQLCWQLKTAYLVIDGDGLKDRMYGVRERTLFPPRLFKSNCLSKDEMTLLGSELFVLGI